MTVKLRDGEVTASEEVLLHLCIALGEASDGYAKRGRSLLAEEMYSDSHAIHEALDASGFFDKVK